MIFKNYYKLLGLPNNTSSTQAEIKSAYRKQAKKYHPDVNVQSKGTEERFKDIGEAYRILSDPLQKRKYDKSWNYYVGRKIAKEKKALTKVGKDDIVNIFFGETTPKKKKLEPIKGQNIETTIDISIKEAFDGAEKNLSLVSKNEKNKKFSVKIPAGIKQGQKIRVEGFGKDGINGGRKGDLIIKVNIVDNGIFKLVGNDINVNLFLSPWDAALGSKCVVDSVDGELTILVPKGTQSGDRLAIPNKGYYVNGKERGRLIINTEVVIPKTLTEDEKNLFAKLKKVSRFDPKNIVNIK